MAIQTLVLFAWLVRAAIIRWRLSKKKDVCLPPPIFPSWIPFAGHIYGIATQGSNPYLSSLWYLQIYFYLLKISAINTKASQFDPKLSN